MAGRPPFLFLLHLLYHGIFHGFGPAASLPPGLILSKLAHKQLSARQPHKSCRPRRPVASKLQVSS
jgi:hypothetical protein